MPRTFWIVLFLLNLPCFASTGPTARELLDRLNTAAQLSTLSDPTLKPWHLQMSFDLLDAKGAVREHGTLQEWWAAPDRFRIAVASPTYTAVETRNGQTSFRTVGQPSRPDLEDLLVSQISEPLQKASDNNGLAAVYEKKRLGKVDLDCIMPAPSDPRIHSYLGQFTTYCFDPGQEDLRVLIRYREQFILRNRIGRFQNRDVSLDISVLDFDKVVLTSHVTQLTTYSPGAHDFEAAPEQQAIPVPRRMSSATMAGMLVTKLTPSYPQRARADHISGAVVLHAIIGDDGHIKDISMIRSPDRLLTDAAMDAVRQWTYRPYVLDGVPTAVETTITVNFNMN